MADEIELRAALNIHLSTMVGSPPIAWENVSYTPDGSLFIEQSINPAEDRSNGVAVGSTDILAGFMQLMINAPKSAGITVYQDELNRIKAHFVRNGSLINGSTRVSLTKIWASSPIPNENYYRVPVSIRYVAV